MYIKILVRESLSHVKRANWNQNEPSTSPKTPGTKEKFGNESIASYYPKLVFARQDSVKDHIRIPCTEKEAPGKQHGNLQIPTKPRSVFLLKRG